MLTSHSICTFSYVEDSLSLFDPAIYHDSSLRSDCLETWKVTNGNQDHVIVRCLAQNSRGSADQRMDDVKEDPCVGFMLITRCCRTLTSTYITVSHFVMRVNISSCVEPQHHFLCELHE